MLEGYRATGDLESADIARIRELLASERDPFSREIPLHVTGSAVIVHPDSGRVLLRWHQRQQAWLPVGGHGDPGETDPLEIALREGREETGPTDLWPWPSADLRFVLATGQPEAAPPYSGSGSSDMWQGQSAPGPGKRLDAAGP